jgi:hypothetical protein
LAHQGLTHSNRGEHVNLRGIIKTGVALKAMEFVKREASKPENQAKAKELAKSVQAKMAQRKGSAAPARPAQPPPRPPPPRPSPDLDAAWCRTRRPAPARC